jgi:hypothetical protein
LEIRKEGGPNAKRKFQRGRKHSKTFSRFARDRKSIIKFIKTSKKKQIPIGLERWREREGKRGKITREISKKGRKTREFSPLASLAGRAEKRGNFN